MVDLLVSLLIFVIVAGVIYYVLTLVPLPEPWGRAVLVIFAAIVLIILLVKFLLPLLGIGAAGTRLLH